MKLTGTDTQSELWLLFQKILATGNPDGSDTRISRGKNGLVKVTRGKIKSKLQRDAEQATDYLMDYLVNERKRVLPEDFRVKMISAIKFGSFDPEYWTECKRLSNVIIETHPGTLPFSGERNYAYPSDFYRPTTSVYLDGVESSGVPEFIGVTEFSEFRDSLLKWRRAVFELPRKIPKASAEPIFYIMSGRIHAESSHFAARHMLSLVAKAWLVDEASAWLTSLEPPIVKPINDWYHYRVPKDGAEPWMANRDYRILKSARSKLYEQTDVDNNRLVLTYAPCPAFGHRWNNNDIVHSYLTRTAQNLPDAMEEEAFCYMVRKAQMTLILSYYQIPLAGGGGFNSYPPNDWVSFASPDVGICMIPNEDTNVPEFYRITSDGLYSRLVLPVENEVFWPNNAEVVGYIRNAEGSLIAINNTLENYQTYVQVSHDTQTISFFDDDIYPHLHNLFGWTTGSIDFCSGDSRYYANEGPYGGDARIAVYASDGQFVEYVDYSSFAQCYQLGIICSTLHTYGFWRELLNGEWWLRIYVLDKLDQHYFASVSLGVWRYFTAAFYDGEIMIVRRLPTDLLIFVSESGVVRYSGPVGANFIGAGPLTMPNWANYI